MAPAEPCARLRRSPTWHGIAYLAAVGRALWVAVALVVIAAVAVGLWLGRDDAAAGCAEDPPVVDAGSC
ncbi:hypothetical protein QQX10_04945 [Demequina sp. SYSU T00039]|uniref:Uncharacterized protein n=1 Tax=Demequina lignilytica TaxID=3051663 RepID=A0AAW7M854_9MICO|nr:MULTISPECIES: hypothetical protein [unclassified Demequina]MDN4477342.1 hypothetical protein [Demequina sp. SYSU T00039-1]MDN4487515.1 hypothetical protein [Demequina sp. SYSU T00039]